MGPPTCVVRVSRSRPHEGGTVQCPWEATDERSVLSKMSAHSGGEGVQSKWESFNDVEDFPENPVTRRFGDLD